MFLAFVSCINFGIWCHCLITETSDPFIFYSIQQSASWPRCRRNVVFSIRTVLADFLTIKKSPELVCSTTILSRQPHATEVKKESKVYWGFFIQMSKSWLIDHSYLSKKSDDILYSSTLYLLLRLPHSHIVPTILTFCYNHFQGHRCKLLEIKKYKSLSLTYLST